MSNSIKKTLLAALVALSACTPSLADSVNTVWVRAEATPILGGNVFVNWYLDGDEIPEDYVSEFKRAVNIGASTAFIIAEPAEGYKLAGFVRDNGNETYDNGVDEQIYVRPDYFFTAKYFPYEYYGDGSSSSSAQYEAEAALEDETEPSDLIFAVFTQGDIAMQAEDQEWMGKVWCNKLDNEAGDEVLFSANGESISPQTGGVKYYKFDHWETPGGETLYDRIISVTVTGGEVYYAHFTETTRDDYVLNEKANPSFTAIRKVSDKEHVSAAEVYDLQGRRVADPVKGVFIQDGRKVVKK